MALGLELWERGITMGTDRFLGSVDEERGHRNPRPRHRHRPGCRRRRGKRGLALLLRQQHCRQAISKAQGPAQAEGFHRAHSNDQAREQSQGKGLPQSKV